MKLDTTYSYIYQCPETNVQVSENEKEFGEICTQCGELRKSLYGTHAVKIVGRWNRPSLAERMLHRKKMEFITKESEDALLEALTQ